MRGWARRGGQQQQKKGMAELACGGGAGRRSAWTSRGASVGGCALLRSGGIAVGGLMGGACLRWRMLGWKEGGGGVGLL